MLADVAADLASTLHFELAVRLAIAQRPPVMAPYIVVDYCYALWHVSVLVQACQLVDFTNASYVTLGSLLLVSRNPTSLLVGWSFPSPY